MTLQNPLLPVAQHFNETLPTASAAGLTSTDVRRVGRSLDQSVSENTRAMYP